MSVHRAAASPPSLILNGDRYCSVLFIRCSCRVYVLRRERQLKTSVKRKTLNPTWNETLRFEVMDDEVLLTG